MTAKVFLIQDFHQHLMNLLIKYVQHKLLWPLKECSFNRTGGICRETTVRNHTQAILRTPDA